MKQHLLLEKVFVYPLPKEEPKLDGCSYDERNGYWLIDDVVKPYVLDNGRPKPQSKKCDVETGEDRKGE